MGCRTDPWCSDDLKNGYFESSFTSLGGVWSPMPIEGLFQRDIAPCWAPKQQFQSLEPCQAQQWPFLELSWSFPGAFPEFPGLHTGCSMANLKIMGFKRPAPHNPKWLTALGASYFLPKMIFPDVVSSSASDADFLRIRKWWKARVVFYRLGGFVLKLWIFWIGWVCPGVLDLLDWMGTIWILGNKFLPHWCLFYNKNSFSVQGKDDPSGDHWIPEFQNGLGWQEL